MKITIPAADFVRIASAVLPLVSKDATRRALNSALFTASEPLDGAPPGGHVSRHFATVTAVGTDGHALATYDSVAFECASDDTGGDVLIPLDTLKDALKAAKACKGFGSVTVEPGRVSVSSGASFVCSDGHDLQFPPYADVMPKYTAEARSARGAGASFFGLHVGTMKPILACIEGAGCGQMLAIPGATEDDPILWTGTTHYGTLTLVQMPCLILSRGEPDPFKAARDRAALIAADCPKLAEVFAPN